MILEYKMHRTGRGKSMMAPVWIEDGGYFYDPATKTFIGWSADEADREYYVPDTVVELTRDELVARVQAKGMNKIDPEDPTAEPVAMTDAEVADYVDTWISQRG